MKKRLLELFTICPEIAEYLLKILISSQMLLFKPVENIIISSAYNTWVGKVGVSRPLTTEPESALLRTSSAKQNNRGERGSP